MSEQTTEQPKLTKNGLAGFYGTSQYYRVAPWPESTIITDGVHHIMECGHCWIVTDVLAVLDWEEKCKAAPFVAIAATRTPDGLRVGYTDGNDNVLYTQDYADHDLPVDLLMFSYDKVLMLASEY